MKQNSWWTPYIQCWLSSLRYICQEQPQAKFHTQMSLVSLWESMIKRHLLFISASITDVIPVYWLSAPPSSPSSHTSHHPLLPTTISVEAFIFKAPCPEIIKCLSAAVGINNRVGLQLVNMHPFKMVLILICCVLKHHLNVSTSLHSSSCCI